MSNTGVKVVELPWDKRVALLATQAKRRYHQQRCLVQLRELFTNLPEPEVLAKEKLRMKTELAAYDEQIRDILESIGVPRDASYHMRRGPDNFNLCCHYNLPPISGKDLNNVPE